MYMKYKTLRFLSLLFLAVIVSVGARAAADSHNPYTAEAKRYDKQPSEKVMEAAKKLADAGDSQKPSSSTRWSADASGRTCRRRRSRRASSPTWR